MGLDIEERGGLSIRVDRVPGLRTDGSGRVLLDDIRDAPLMRTVTLRSPTGTAASRRRASSDSPARSRNVRPLRVARADRTAAGDGAAREKTTASGRSDGIGRSPGNDQRRRLGVTRAWPRVRRELPRGPNRRLKRRKESNPPRRRVYPLRPIKYRFFKSRFSDRTAEASRRSEASLGKSVATRVRGLISLLSCSRLLVVRSGR